MGVQGFAQLRPMKRFSQIANFVNVGGVYLQILTLVIHHKYSLRGVFNMGLIHFIKLYNGVNNVY